jgi:hypothetical protein
VVPLPVFAVILSEAKDPDELHPPIPLEPFSPLSNLAIARRLFVIPKQATKK